MFVWIPAGGAVFQGTANATEENLPQPDWSIDQHRCDDGSGQEHNPTSAQREQAA